MTLHDLAAPVSQTSGALWRRWVGAFVIGELVGFIPPALTGALLASLGASDVMLVVGLTIAGMGEGAALGTAQAHVLGTRWPALSRRRWVVATTASAALAWLVGMGGSALASGLDVAPLVAIAVLAPSALLALASMGFLQWRVLRTVVPDSARWVPINTGAWLVGVMIPVAALSAVPNSWPTAVHVVVAVASAVAMGLVVGSITGLTLETLAGEPGADPSAEQQADGADSGSTLPPLSARMALAARFAWTAISCFIVVSVIVGLASLPATLFYRWHLSLGVSPEPLRLFLLAAAALPAYLLFALLFMWLSAEASRLLGWRPSHRAELTINDLPPELLDWARYSIMNHLVHVVAGIVFRSTPVWVWYMRRNGARIGRHVWINSLQVGDDCLLDLGDNVVIGAGVHLSAHTVENGRVLLAPVTLGRGTTVGVGAHIGIGVETGEGTQIGAMSVVPKHARLEPHTTYVGIPARPLPSTEP